MKVLVLYATAGAGHRMAAQYVYDELKSSTDHTAVFADSLDYTNKVFKTLYPGVYTFMISKLSWLWGFCFALLDIPFLLPFVRFVRRIYNGLNAGPLCRYLEREQFDVIVSSHFLGNEVAACLKRKGKIRSKIISVVTDYDVHSIWLADGIDYYTGATEFTKEKLQRLGVPPEKAIVTGIPTHPKFSQTKDVPALKRRLGLKENFFTVLIATGSFGIGPIEELVDLLDGIQVMVISGHNKELYQRLSKKYEAQELVKIFGLVKNMDEMMAAADAMITKPGGLSVTEALVSGLPLFFFSAIPGQETNNIHVLQTYGIGFSGGGLKDLTGAVRRLSVSEEERRAMKEKIRSVARPDAVKKIVELIQS